MYNPSSLTLAELQRMVAAARPASEYPHDPYILTTLEEAVRALEEGNLGVGSILVDGRGQIVERGHNRMFEPYFRSDLHAEMQVMTTFEDRAREVVSLKDYTLFSSFIPCPMCLARLIHAGVGQVYHAAADVPAPSRLDSLPPFWQTLARGQVFGPANCSPALSDMAYQAFLLAAQKVLEKLQQRRM
jgi:tRNA(adenine34) deaminase